MFDSTFVKACYDKIIGLKSDNFDQCLPKFSRLGDSISELYVDELSDLKILSLENLIDVIPNFSERNYPIWDSLTTYNAGDIVIYESLTNSSIRNAYKCLNNLVTSDPSIDTVNWISLVEEYLLESRNKAITGFFREITTQAQINENTKELLKVTDLYNYDYANLQQIQKQGRFVGLRFRMIAGEKVTILHKIAMTLSALQANLNVYLYHESQTTPLATFNFTNISSGFFNWLNMPTPTTDYKLFNKIDTLSPNGYFYLGYYEDDLDLGVNALSKEIVWSYNKSNCSSCTIRTDLFYLKNEVRPFFEVMPFYFAADAINVSRNLPDLTKIQMSSHTFGFNLQISITCNISYFLCRNKQQFAYPLQVYWAKSLLTEMSQSTRDNRGYNKLKDQAIALLAEGSPFLKTYYSALSVAKKTIGQSDFDHQCLNKYQKSLIGYVVK